VLEHAPKHLLAVTHARGTRRVVAVDLDEPDVVGMQGQQGLDIPILIAAPERLEIERCAGLDGSFLYLLRSLWM
jgi:hypothetical protein